METRRPSANETLLGRIDIAEHSKGGQQSLALLRWTLVVVFFSFGTEKFTAYAAEGIAPLISHSPLVGWLQVFGVVGESRVIGAIEIATGLALAFGSFNAIASAAGAAMSCATFLITASFLLSTPGVVEPKAGGFPFLSTLPGQFLLKDIVLLAASLTLLLSSTARLWSRRI